MRNVGRRRALREWRRGKIERKRYIEEKSKYKERCERKNREKKEKRIREIGKIKRETKLWKMVKRERRGRSKINEGIGEEK